MTNAPAEIPSGTIINPSPVETMEITPIPGDPPIVLGPGESWTTTDVEQFFNAIDSMEIGGVRVPPATEVPLDPTLVPTSNGGTQAEIQSQLDDSAIASGSEPTVIPGTTPHEGTMGSPSTRMNSGLIKPFPRFEENVGPTTPTESRKGEKALINTQGADPVDLCSGEFTIEETDIVLPNAIIPLSLTRYYRSGTPSFGPFGYNWDHNHNIFLRELDHNVVTRWNGQVHEDRFFQIGSSSDYEPQRGIFEKLEKNTTRDYTLTAPGGIVYRFFDNPGDPIDLLGRIPLREVEDRFGNRLIYDYFFKDGLFYLETVLSERDERYLNFRYGNCDLLEWVDDWFIGEVEPERTIYYYHDPDIQHLIGVRLPITSDHPEGTLKTYEYLPITEAYALRHNIVGVIDGNNNYTVYNTYEKDPSSPKYSKVIQQIFGDQQYTFDYAVIQLLPASEHYVAIPSYQTLMTAPDGGKSIYTFNYRGDLLDHRMHVTSVTGAFETVITTYEYDAQGNRIRVVNENDHLETHYEYLYSGDPIVDVRLWGKLTKVIQNSTLAPIERILWKGEYDLNPGHYQELLREWDERAIEALVTLDSGLTVYHYTPSGADAGKYLEKITFPDTTAPVLPVPSPQTREILIDQDGATGRITKITSPEVYDTVFTYGVGSYDRLSKIERDVTHVALDPKAETLFEYDTLGFPAETTDITGAVTEFTYNDQGQLEVTTLPPIGASSPTVIQHYDVNGFLSRIEYPKGSFTELGFADTHIDQIFKRDVYGYPTTDTFGSNTEKPFTLKKAFNYRGNVLRSVLPNGAATISTYDERGSIKRERVQGTDGAFSLREWQYTPSGFVKNVRQGPLLDIITWMEYDVFNVPTTTMFGADGGGIPNVKGYSWFGYTWTTDTTTLTSWGISGMTWYCGTACRVTMEEYREYGTDTLMSRVIRQYDERGRVILVRTAQFSDPLTITYLDTLFFYDREDQLIKVEGPHVIGGVHQTVEHSYDGLGRVTQNKDPLGNIENLTYDLSARTVTVQRVDQEPGGGTSTRSWKEYFDIRGRMTQFREPGNIDTFFEYDDRNLQTKLTMPNSVEVTSAYGLLGQKLTQTVDPATLNYTHTWEYDNVYQLSEYTDPSSQSTTYHYDGLGRLLKRVLPGNYEFLTEYGTDGRVKSHTQPSTAKTSFSYDVYGRLSSFSATAGIGSGVVNAVPTHSYTYDALDRMLTGNVSSGPAVTRTYDSLSNLMTEINHGETMSATYDLVNGIITKDFGSSVTETHTLNFNGIPSSVVRTVSGTPSTLLSNLQMSGPSMLGSATLRGSNTVTAIYDDRRRLNQLKFTKTGQTVQCDYRYDLNSRRAIDKLTAPASSYNRLYGFDNQSRLITSKALSGTPALTAGITQADNTFDITTTYGPAPGTTKTTGYNSGDERTIHDGTSYTYNTGHRLASAGATSATTYGDGPLLTLGTLDFEIDALGRITKIDNDVTITFDALGRPSILTDGANPTRKFCYFGEDLWLELANNVRERYITHHPLMNGYLGVHMATPGPSYLCFNDARMNRLAVVNPAGNIVQSYNYDTFGEQTGVAPAILEPLFGGMRYQASKGIFLSRSRLYKPEHGIFLSADPLGYIDSQNLYAYVAHNPANFVDPFGWAAGQPPGEAAGDGGYRNYTDLPPVDSPFESFSAYKDGVRRFRGVDSLCEAYPSLIHFVPESKKGIFESWWEGFKAAASEAGEFGWDLITMGGPLSVYNYGAQQRMVNRLNSALEGAKFVTVLANPHSHALRAIVAQQVAEKVSEMDGSDWAHLGGRLSFDLLLSAGPLALTRGGSLAQGANILASNAKSRSLILLNKMTTADGFLLGSIHLKKGLPFNLTLQQYASPVSKSTGLGAYATYVPWKPSKDFGRRALQITGDFQTEIGAWSEVAYFARQPVRIGLIGYQRGQPVGTWIQFHIPRSEGGMPLIDWMPPPDWTPPTF